MAVCDLYDGRRELAKEIVNKEIPTARHYQELLDNKEIDCIVAAVPDHWHKQIVVACCNAGKDVYCEKPMTLKGGLTDMILPLAAGDPAVARQDRAMMLRM